jgi:hypothetical protein
MLVIHGSRSSQTIYNCEHKVSMCHCGSFCDEWLSTWSTTWVECDLTMTWVELCDMSLGLWCAGVEFGGGGRRQGEGQVETCRADDSSLWDRFDPFLLRWSDLWRELRLSTEGNHPIPHKITDRDKSWTRVSKPAFSVPLWFPVNWLQIGRWPLRGSSSTALWSCVPSLVAAGVDLATNRVNLCSWQFLGELIRDLRIVRSSSPDSSVSSRLRRHCVQTRGKSRVQVRTVHHPCASRL